MTRRITHWIDGKPFGGISERSADVYDPATGQVAAQVDLADTDTTDLAVAAAVSAAREWAQSSLSVRTRVLFKFRELLDSRKEDVAAA
ncbi:MAG: methylmalonate-semialdehyde dehydrogenase, partial [Marmoricola sp.]|nr:methylmalonate-semialdehyde dehydrogenase [Marmoricola sp.]